MADKKRKQCTVIWNLLMPLSLFQWHRQNLLDRIRSTLLACMTVSRRQDCSSQTLHSSVLRSLSLRKSNLLNIKFSKKVIETIRFYMEGSRMKLYFPVLMFELFRCSRRLLLCSEANLFDVHYESMMLYWHLQTNLSCVHSCISVGW